MARDLGQSRIRVTDPITGSIPSPDARDMTATSWQPRHARVDPVVGMSLSGSHPARGLCENCINL